jgi:hypothetical protein
MPDRRCGVSAEDSSRWRLSLGILIILAGLLLANTVSVVWWAASINERVAHIERAEAMQQALISRVTALEGDARSNGSAWIRVEAKLDRLIERLMP